MIFLPTQANWRGPSELKEAVQWVWQEISRYLKAYNPEQFLTLAADTSLTADYCGYILLCTGTHNLTLPDPVNQLGNSYYFFNYDVGVITIVGTINGGANYTLNNQYQYVRITGDGTNYIVTENN